MKSLLYLILFFTLPFSLSGQASEKDNQWWVGLKTGFNSSNVVVGEEYHILSFTDESSFEKNYDVKYKKGYQIGLIGVYDIGAGLNISIQPSYVNQKIAYTNNMSWSSDNDILEIEDAHTHSLDFVYLPILLRYELNFSKSTKTSTQKMKQGRKNTQYSSKTGGRGESSYKFKPYLQVGYFYSRLIGAQKNINRTETVNGFEYQSTDQLIGVQELFNKGNSGFSFGGGASCDIGGSFRLAADISYQVPLSNIINQKNRFSDNELSLKYYDTLDDMKLRNLNFSIHFLFPLRFVYSNNFKSI